MVVNTPWFRPLTPDFADVAPGNPGSGVLDPSFPIDTALVPGMVEAEEVPDLVEHRHIAVAARLQCVRGPAIAFLVEDCVTRRIRLLLRGIVAIVRAVVVR